MTRRRCLSLAELSRSRNRLTLVEPGRVASKRQRMLCHLAAMKTKRYILIQTTLLPRSILHHRESLLLDPPSRQRASVDYRHDQREDSSNSVKPPPRKTEAQPLQRAQSLSKLTHALPPKPIVAPPPYIPPAIVHPSTLASSMVYRDRRSNGHPKQLSSSQDAFDALPSDWEVRYPRNGGREAYYYNVRTHESTWTRPGPMSSGRSSPSKERDSDSIHLGGSRSPIRGLTDDSARMRTDKRRTSPGGTLTYEDRHYRPEGSSGPEVQVQVDRRDSYSTSPRSHGRPLSPPLRVDERRAPRSPSPALRRRSRSMERSGRGSRRDISPSASDLNAWREATRGDYPSRHPPIQERAWGRPRNMSPPENNPVRSFDDRSTAPRGRRHRMDVEPPAQSLPIPQDTRNNSNNEWSASSTLSASSHLPTCRLRRLCSSRGGGYVYCNCLEPRELSYAVHPYPFFCRLSSLLDDWPLIMDPLFCFFSLPCLHLRTLQFLTLPSLSLSLFRAQVSSTAST